MPQHYALADRTGLGKLQVYLCPLKVPQPHRWLHHLAALKPLSLSELTPERTGKRWLDPSPGAGFPPQVWGFQLGSGQGLVPCLWQRPVARSSEKVQGAEACWPAGRALIPSTGAEASSRPAPEGFRPFPFSGGWAPGCPGAQEGCGRFPRGRPDPAAPRLLRSGRKLSRRLSSLLQIWDPI